MHITSCSFYERILEDVHISSLRRSEYTATVHQQSCQGAKAPECFTYPLVCFSRLLFHGFLCPVTIAIMIYELKSFNLAWCTLMYTGEAEHQTACLMQGSCLWSWPSLSTLCLAGDVWPATPATVNWTIVAIWPGPVGLFSVLGDGKPPQPGLSEKENLTGFHSYRPSTGPEATNNATKTRFLFYFSTPSSSVLVHPQAGHPWW